MGRVGRAADWLLWAGLGAGLGLYFGLAALRGSTHTLRWDQWADGVRLGALALACACPGMLALGWAGRQLASVRKNRAAKREARRAVLIKHADPLAQTVAEHSRQIAFLTRVLTGAAEGYDIPGDAVAKTQPILKVIGGKRDSA